MSRQEYINKLMENISEQLTDISLDDFQNLLQKNGFDEFNSDIDAVFPDLMQSMFMNQVKDEKKVNNE
tara:strand:+ start:423 stop:626 length:204 start_codon:yes stop_codon:yes gene_type:complete